MENLYINKNDCDCSLHLDNKQNAIDKFDHRIESIRQRINKRLSCFSDNSSYHADLSEFVTKSYDILLSPDAKRIRSVIPVLIAQILTVDEDECIMYGVIIELLHFTSLIHDDVIDNDIFRRGYSTLNSLFMKNQAVLIGDYMMAEVVSYCLAAKYNTTVIRFVVEAAKNLISGLIIEQNRMPDNPSLKSYIEMVKLKTGALFRLSFGLPFIQDERMAKAMSCGEKFGILFQIYDDFIDKDKDKSYENIFNIMPVSDVSQLWKDNYSALLKISNAIGIEVVVHDIFSYLRSLGYRIDSLFQQPLQALSP